MKINIPEGPAHVQALSIASQINVAVDAAITNADADLRDGLERTIGEALALVLISRYGVAVARHVVCGQ